MNPARIAASLAFALLATLTADGLELRSGDSLDVRVAGAGGGLDNGPEGVKGFAGALAYLTFWHPFNDNIFARVTVRGSEDANLPFIVEGLAGWQRRGFQVVGGFLSDRYGQTRFYDNRVFVNPLFDKYLLWDTYGMGFRASEQVGPVRFDGGFTVDNLESGAAHATVDFAQGPWEARLLGGFQTYDPSQQDNLWTAGAELAAQWRHAGVHVVGVCDRYLGYGHATNYTMVPGWLGDGYVEAFVAPIDQIRLSGLFRYTRYQKRYEHEELSGGAELEWLPLTWLGGGAGLDANRDQDLTTLAPAVFVDVKPEPGRAELRIYANRRVTGDSHPTYTVGGTVWLDL